MLGAATQAPHAVAATGADLMAPAVDVTEVNVRCRAGLNPAPC